MIFKPSALALAAQVVYAFQLQPRDQSSNDDYPFCTIEENPNCIEDGKYLVPQLDFSLENDIGDNAYNQYLPTHTYTVSQWPRGKMPEVCYYWAVTADHWNASDFVMYNVTYSDCTTPYVICWHNKAPKGISEIATVISRIPIGMRQATSLFLVYGDNDSDNPSYGGYMATYAPHGIIIGRSKAYFTTSLVHEMGHAVDSNLVSPDAPHPGSGTSFSSTSTWHSAADADGFAVSAYGAGSYTEDFPEAGRAVLIDNIYPGGLEVWSNQNPNLTQITHQVATFKSVAGSFYNIGGACDAAHKFPYPTSLVSV